MPTERPLEPRQQRFVEEYLVDLNASQACIRAGYKSRTQVDRLMANPRVQAAVAAGRARITEKTEADATMVVRRWLEIATADPNALIQHRRGPCRYCHGINNRYQWKTRREFEEQRAKTKGRRKPTDEGGYGYRVTAPINPDCPECSGEGIGYTLAADTRKLPDAARVLYAGAKQGKDGLEIKMQDQGKALENLARHFGMFVDRHEIGGKGGGPINITISKDDANL